MDSSAEPGSDEFHTDDDKQKRIIAYDESTWICDMPFHFYRSSDPEGSPTGGLVGHGAN